MTEKDSALRRSRCVAAPGLLLAGRCQCTKKQARPAASRSARLGAPCMSEFPLAGLQQAVLRARLCSCTGPSAAGLSLKTQCPVGSCIMFISSQMRSDTGPQGTTLARTILQHCEAAPHLHHTHYTAPACTPPCIPPCIPPCAIWIPCTTLVLHHLDLILHHALHHALHHTAPHSPAPCSPCTTPWTSFCTLHHSRPAPDCTTFACTTLAPHLPAPHPPCTTLACTTSALHHKSKVTDLAVLQQT